MYIQQSTKFKLTFMQKLLGRRYKWWYIIKFYRDSQLTYNGNSFFHSLSSVCSFLILVLTWYIGSNNNSGLDFRAILTYLVVGYMYSAFTPMWISEMLGYKIYSGALTTYLIKPTSIFWLGLFEMVGRGVVVASILVLVPYLIILPFILPYMTVSTNWQSYLGLFLMIPITLMIRYCIDFMVGCYSFWIVSNGGFIRFYTTIFAGLNGSTVPLTLISRFAPIITFLPTAFVIYYPVELYLNPNLADTLNIFAGGIAWCVILYFLAKIVFKLGLKKNEAVGL
jgi:ABC-2 type transport system permease protein